MRGIDEENNGTDESFTSLTKLMNFVDIVIKKLILEHFLYYYNCRKFTS